MPTLGLGQLSFYVSFPTQKENMISKTVNICGGEGIFVSSRPSGKFHMVPVLKYLNPHASKLDKASYEIRLKSIQYLKDFL